MAAYVSPLLISHKGKKQIITALATHIIGIHPQTGKIEWKVNYLNEGQKSRRAQLNTNTPLFRNGRLFVTSGYDHGGIMLQLADNLKSAKVIHTIPDLDTHHGGSVLVGNTIYGSNWINNKKGNWVAIDWKTGKTQYEKKWGGKGSIIAADNMLYLYEELRGNLGLAYATPKGLEIVSSFKIKKGNNQHWCHPVISDGRLYLRRGKVLMVYNLKK